MEDKFDDLLKILMNKKQIEIIDELILEVDDITLEKHKKMSEEIYKSLDDMINTADELKAEVKKKLNDEFQPKIKQLQEKHEKLWEETSHKYSLDREKSYRINFEDGKLYEKNSDDRNEESLF